MSQDTPRINITAIETTRAYLATLPIEDHTQAETQLLQLLDALILNPPALPVLFQSLELIRAPLHEIETELGNRYQNKAIPLPGVEDEWFRKIVSAWERMSHAYGMCAQLAGAQRAAPEHAGLMATVLHRHLYYTGRILFEHYLARRELPEGIWIKVHYLYETAEKWGVANTPVEDDLETPTQSTHCAAAYIALLLTDMASPYSHPVRNLLLIRRWAQLWSPLVSIQLLDDDYELPPYIVQFNRDLGLHSPGQNETAGNQTRYLDTMRLGPQLHHMTSQLRQRMTPSQLGLGNETSGYCIRLLDRLARPWQQMASPRRFRRFNTRGSARVVQGFPAMHYYVSGQEFFQPDAEVVYSRGDFDRLFTFSERVDRGSGMAIAPHPDFPVDHWEVINHSANGFRLARTAVGQRLLLGALLAVCPHDGEHFLLAQSTWLMQTRDTGLIVGLAVLPGIPVAVGARYQGIGQHNQDHFVRAFLLPAVDTIHEEASLILPSGMYQGGRLVEIHTGEKTLALRMRNVVMHGTDFDRVTYESASDEV